MSDAEFAAYEAKCAIAATLAAEVLPLTKRALFEALAQAGIHTVVVCFDGSGDSGQVETVDGFDSGNNLVQLTTDTIGFSEVDFESSSIRVEQKAARAVVEIMTYDFLRQTHGGWENNDGAYGEFTFDVAEQTIALDFNERFTDFTNYQHEF